MKKSIWKLVNYTESKLEKIICITVTRFYNLETWNTYYKLFWIFTKHTKVYRFFFSPSEEIPLSLL